MQHRRSHRKFEVFAHTYFLAIVQGATPKVLPTVALASYMISCQTWLNVPNTCLLVCLYTRARNDVDTATMWFTYFSRWGPFLCLTWRQWRCYTPPCRPASIAWKLGRANAARNVCKPGLTLGESVCRARADGHCDCLSTDLASHPGCIITGRL